MARKRTSVNIYQDQVKDLKPEANKKFEGNVSQLVRRILDDYLEKQKGK